MPLATAGYIQTTDPWEHEIMCAHCGTRVFAQYGAGNSDGRFTWHHDYQGPWFGQMICDPQQARAALQGRQPHHATP